jgi:hypothetical protein
MKNNLNPIALFIFTFFWGLPFPNLAKAQCLDTLTNETSLDIKHLSVLADKNYTFPQILSDTSLKFVKRDTVKPRDMGVYWVKCSIYNPFAYSERYFARFFPMLDNTLYYFDYNQNKWVESHNGVMVANNKHNFMNLPCVLQAKQENILYIKTDVRAVSAFPHSLKSGLMLMKEAESLKRKEALDLSTAITIWIVFAFFLFNAYIYYIFRDNTYFYYLLTQIGGILYILANFQYFYQLIKPRFCQVALDSSGAIWFYDLNGILVRLSITIILFAFIQLTRTYLNTRELMPKQDKILKYSGYIFASIMGILTLLSMLGQFIVSGSTIVDNIMVVVIVLAIFYVSVVSYRLHYKAAGYFLLANLIPLTLILFLGVYFLVSNDPLNGLVYQIANIAVIAQAFCLALALVKRFLLIRDELKQKQLEAQELTAQNERIATELSYHKAELHNFTQSLREKTDAFEKLKTEFDIQNTDKIQQNWLDQLNQATILTEEQWRSFRQKFENVHSNFFNRLQEQIPTATEAEKRFIALTKLDMTNNEIASMLGISPESVSKTRYRLRKKMGEEDLERLVESL